MNLSVSKKQIGEAAFIILEGRLDTNTAPELEKELSDEFFNGISSLTFDFKNLDYISSAGLRTVLSAQKKMQKQSGNMKIENVSRDVYDVFETTGFSEIIKIKKALRQVSIENCELIGAGMCGECWRLDEESILKLYYENEPITTIENEKAYAKAAFIAGIPTAISYDMVACGNRLGVIFEMLHAETVAKVILNDLDNMEKHVKMIVDLIKQVHETLGDSSILLNRIDTYQQCLAKVTNYFETDELQSLQKMLDKLPIANTCIHGDFHPKNIMMQDGKMLFIDMGDFSIGHPFFDIAHVFNVFLRDFPISNLGVQLSGMETKTRTLFWKYFIKYYFQIESKSELEQLNREIEPFNCIRQLAYIPIYEQTRNENIMYVREVLKNFK